MTIHIKTADSITKLNLKLPVIQAPMLTTTTPDLVAAVSNFGALGSLAAGMSSPKDIQQNILAIKEKTDRPFNVNLFVVNIPPSVSPEKFEKANRLFNPIRRKLGIPINHPISTWLIQDFENQLEALIEAAPPVASFTFGLLDSHFIERLKSVGSIIIGTATNVAEAKAWEANGADIICAQGFEAGGHRGSFIGDPTKSYIGTMALVPQIVDAVNLPVIAAGGIMDGRGIAAALSLGAKLVQLGTAFLTCAETNISASWKEQILTSQDTSTKLTHVFSGKLVRAIDNELIEMLEKHESDILPFPIQHSLTKDIREQAIKMGLPEFFFCWAGQAAPLSRKRNKNIGVMELLKALDEEYKAILKQLYQSL